MGIHFPNRTFLYLSIISLFMTLLQSGPEFPVSVLVIHRCHWHSFILPLRWPVGERLMSCVSIHSMELLDLYKVTLLQYLISKREKKSIIYEHIPSPWLIVYFLRNCFDVTSKTLIEVCRKAEYFPLHSFNVWLLCVILLQFILVHCFPYVTLSQFVDTVCVHWNVTF